MLNLYYLIYCNIIWGGTGDVHLGQLKLLQKKFVRLITNSQFLDHTDPLFLKTGILKIDDIHSYLLSIHAFKNISDYSSHLHTHDTRNKDGLVPQFQRLSLTQRSVSYTVPKVWNSLPDYIKQCSTLSIFKSELKRFLIAQYSD